MALDPVTIQFEENNSNGWINLDIGRLDPNDGTDFPFGVIANRFKSSSPECEIFLHQPLQMLIELAATDPVVAAFMDGVGGSSKVSTSIVNHDETLGALHMYVMLTRGRGCGTDLGIHIQMWKIAPPVDEDGAVVVAAKSTQPPQN